MTPEEAGQKIIGYWSIGLTSRSIEVLMICSNVLLSKAEVETIIREYVDHEDRAKCNGPCSPDFDLREWMR